MSTNDQGYDHDYEEDEEQEFTQYNYNSRTKTYTPMGVLNLKEAIKPGYYDGFFTDEGPRIRKIETRLDGLVTFGRGVAGQIVDEIEQFWGSEQQFRKINKSIKVLYKRGILMYGPPGCGKSSMISIIMNEVVKRKGIALRFNGSNVTTEFIRMIRQVQPSTKIIVVLEDIDGFISRNGEEDILNMLDGVDTVLDNILFIATSNYVQDLSTRLLRPSRFDLKIELDYPEAAMRKKYLQELYKSTGTSKGQNLSQSVRDTEGFSFADLKELFISTCVFGRDYKKAVNGLKNALNSEEKLRALKNRRGIPITANRGDDAVRQRSRKR